MTRVSVVVPAHDEEELIDACVSSILRSREHLTAVAPRVTCSIVVVLDACADGTAHRLTRFGAEIDVVEVRRRSVGAARRAGSEHALALAGPDDHWLAQTDADSVVPDLSTFDDRQRERWQAAHPTGTAGDIHGANLGVAAETYVRIGGYADLREHEDIDLVSRLRAAGGRVEATPDMPVSTSGRRVGRTRGGFAGFLSAVYPVTVEQPR